MHIRFIGSGDPSEDAECVAFGITFPVNQWVDVAEIPSRLLTNPAFEIERQPPARRVKRGHLS